MDRQRLADLAARGVDESGATIAVDGDGENLILVDPGANNLLSPDEVETAGLPAAEAVTVQLEILLPTCGTLAASLAEGRAAAGC
jgi:sugar/nucleoside kinase (ribokinase family)